MYKKYIKRLLDIVLTLIAIIITLPIFLIIGILVLIFLGKPAIFRQKRPGKNEKIFTMYKFRTMSNKKDKDGNLLPNELRITKFGNFLRKTSLDEIPEFINILKGDMSFIGNRPYLPREKEDMTAFYDDIVKTKPGLTGWWQVNGRSDVTFRKRLELESYYSKNQSLWLDIKIFFKTFKVVFLGRDSK